MGVLSRMEARARAENPAVPLSSANIISTLGIGEDTPAGVTVTDRKALGITAFWAGVRAISQTIAGLPFQVYKKDGKNRELAEDHPVHRLLHIRPNPHMTPFVFKEVRTAHLLTWGNSYAEIERNGADDPIALWPLLPDRTGVEVRNGQKYYYTIVDGAKIYLSPDNVLHVAGLGFDGLRGYNVIKIHKDSLGLSIAANEYGSQFFGNSGRPSGYLKHPGQPNIDERKQLRDEWNQVHSGLTRAQRTAVLWGNMEWQQISINPEEAQFLETRGLQIEEVARILNINPILLQHFTKATTWGSGIAQFLVAFGKFTIAPWLDREEDAVNYDLFSESERGTYYAKYNLDALLRGDPKTQAEVLEIKRRNGVINADEWRALDEDNPLPDGQGKHYFMPLNMATIEQLAAQPTPQNDLPPDPQRSLRAQRGLTMRDRLRDAHQSAFRDGAMRYVRREHEALTAAVKRIFGERADPTRALDDWIDDFYPGQQRAIYNIMRPLVDTLSHSIAAEAADEVGADVVDMSKFADEYTENLARREVNSSIGQIRALTKEVPVEDLGAAITTRADEWLETRADKVAQNEVVRVANGAARDLWQAVGVRGYVWHANPDACPLCKELHGKRIGATDYFLNPGESISVGEKTALVAEHHIAGPPLHQGCQCSLLPDV